MIGAIRPLFISGYFPMHDDTQVSRVIEMGKALNDGQFPVRWVADLGYGYGYPIFNFYGPLPYYVGGVLYAIGVSALIATKIMFAIGILVPAIILFWVMSITVGWQAGLLTCVLFLYAPYHAVQIYVRGAVGEYWELIFWPIIYYAFVYWEKSKKRYTHLFLGSIGISGAILSHTLLGYVTVLLVSIGYVGYWAYRMFTYNFNKHTALFQAIAILLGLGISSFFWLPAIVEMGFTAVSGQVNATAHYLDHFVCMSQLWSSLWGYGGSVKGCIDGQSYMLGKVHVLIATVTLLLWRYFSYKEAKTPWTIGLVSLVVGVFFSTSYSHWVWSVLPGFAFLQYPWRFLALAGFGLSLVGGVLPMFMPKGYGKTVITIVLSFLVFGMNIKWFTPQYTYDIASSAFEDPVDLRWRVSRISDEYLPAKLIRPTDESEVVFDTIDHGNALIVTNVMKSSVYERVFVTATESATVMLNKAYFPGWRYFVDQKEVLPIIQDGLPYIQIHKGKSEIRAIFTNTPVRIIGNVISLISIIVLGGIYYGKQSKTKR